MRKDTEGARRRSYANLEARGEMSMKDCIRSCSEWMLSSQMHSALQSGSSRYGGWGAHGGGAFSGKDPTKVDRSAAYICRQMAKSIVKSGLSKRALVQLSYAIGVAKPLSLFVETYGTEQNNLTPEDITKVVKIAFDCRPGAIAKSLQLREPKYQVRRGE